MAACSGINTSTRIMWDTGRYTHKNIPQGRPAVQVKNYVYEVFNS